MPDWEIQVMVKGLALAFFKGIQAYSDGPFIRKLPGLVLRDEAPHFAIGHESSRFFDSIDVLDYAALPA